jgi:hypothetical protein
MLGNNTIINEVSMVEYLKNRYKLPLTEEQEQRAQAFFDSIDNKKENSSVHFISHNSIESLDGVLTLNRSIEIDRMMESVYTEDIVFSLFPVQPGILAETRVKTHHNTKLDSISYPDPVVDPNMTYNIIVIRSFEYYMRKDIVDRIISDSITYDIIILNTALDIPIDGIIFEDIDEEEFKRLGTKGEEA